MRFIEVTALYEYPEPYFKRVLVNVETIKWIAPIMEDEKNRNKWRGAATAIKFQEDRITAVKEEYAEIKRMLIDGKEAD